MTGLQGMPSPGWISKLEDVFYVASAKGLADEVPLMDLTIPPALPVVTSQWVHCYFSLPMPLMIFPLRCWSADKNKLFYSGASVNTYNLKPSSVPEVYALQYTLAAPGQPWSVVAPNGQTLKSSTANLNIHAELSIALSPTAGQAMYHHLQLDAALQGVFGVPPSPLDLHIQPVSRSNATPSCPAPPSIPSTSSDLLSLWELNTDYRDNLIKYFKVNPFDISSSNCGPAPTTFSLPTPLGQKEFDRRMSIVMGHGKKHGGRM
jgi:hypothetical protein